MNGIRTKAMKNRRIQKKMIIFLYSFPYSPHCSLSCQLAYEFPLQVGYLRDVRPDEVLVMSEDHVETPTERNCIRQPSRVKEEKERKESEDKNIKKNNNKKIERSSP
jgi:hypothetical protein